MSDTNRFVICANCEKPVPLDHMLELIANDPLPPDDQVHPVDRMDGERPDGNPGTIGLLDEAIRKKRGQINHMSQQLSVLEQHREKIAQSIAGKHRSAEEPLTPPGRSVRRRGRL